MSLRSKYYTALGIGLAAFIGLGLLGKYEEHMRRNRPVPQLTEEELAVIAENEARRDQKSHARQMQERLTYLNEKIKVHKTVERCYARDEKCWGAVITLAREGGPDIVEFFRHYNSALGLAGVAINHPEQLRGSDEIFYLPIFADSANNKYVECKQRVAYAQAIRSLRPDMASSMAAERPQDLSFYETPMNIARGYGCERNVVEVLRGVRRLEALY